MRRIEKIILISFTFMIISIVVIVNLFNKETYAKQDINDIINLTYTTEDAFYDNLYNYIDLVDDIAISYSSYNISDNLNENYDFLVVFAINFIKQNKEYYQDLIINNYKNYNYGEYGTTEYIDLEEIYFITYNVFGMKDFYIINDYLEVKDNKIPLLSLYEREFEMNLKELRNIKVNNNILTVEAIYNYNNEEMIYNYTFSFIDDKLVIKNISL